MSLAPPSARWTSGADKAANLDEHGSSEHLSPASPLQLQTSLSVIRGERPRSKSMLSPIGANAHKRAGSSNFISRLSFFRAGLSENNSNNALSPGEATDNQPIQSKEGKSLETKHDDNHQERRDTSPKRASAMASTVKEQQQGRKRKGSLRKTVLQGTSMLRRSSNTANTISPDNSSQPKGKSKDEGQQRPISAQKNRFSHLYNRVYPSIESRTEAKASLACLSTSDSTLTRSSTSGSKTNSTSTPTTSRTGAYASTTSDDDFASNEANGRPDSLVLHIPSKPAIPTLPLTTNAKTSFSLSSPSSASESPLTATASSSPVRNRVGSPLGLTPDTPTSIVVSEEGWDYSETAWWGWVVLIVTWIVFVVGMGSCFEVWSWAWDVGETPYAPPELEDDPTLPIVGYYPALMVLTGVMSWVWVVVAWVGMKYFKHAKIQTDDDMQ